MLVRLTYLIPAIQALPSVSVNCSHMKLWRLRNDGQLPAPIKIGGGRSNLTPMEAVLKLEATFTEKAA